MKLSDAFRTARNWLLAPSPVLTINIADATEHSPKLILRVPEESAPLLRHVGAVWSACLTGDKNHYFPTAIQRTAREILGKGGVSQLAQPGPDGHSLEIQTPHYRVTPDGYADFSLPVLKTIARLHCEIRPHLTHVNPAIEKAIRTFDQHIYLTPAREITPKPAGNILMLNN